MTDIKGNIIGNALKKFFNEKNLTQKDVAARLGVTQANVSALLNGKPFGKKLAIKWEEEFGIQSSWLLTGHGEMFKFPRSNGNEEKRSAKTDIEKFIQETIKVNIGISEEVEKQYRDDNSRLIRQIENMQEMINDLREEIKELKVSSVQQNKNIG